LNFAKAIEKTIRQSAVVLVLIGFEKLGQEVKR